LKETGENLPNLEAEFSKVEQELKEIVVNEQKLIELVKKNRQNFNEAQSSFSSNRNRGRVLSYLMKLKSEGKINGIYGRLVNI
jgi:structural maintenance of chromosome 4